MFVVSGTTVVVSNSGGLLSVLVRAPKALLAKETVGLLVDGCISVAGHKSVTGRFTNSSFHFLARIMIVKNKGLVE